MTLVANLRLRFGAARLPARAYLPSPSRVAAEGAPLVFWLAGRNAGDALCRELSAAAAAVVLELGSSDGASGRGLELAALGWAAEHAREFGACEGPVVVAGQLAGAARAARLAIDARDSGWPVLRRQVLVRPAFPAPGMAPSHVAGTAPATIVTGGARGDDGSRYAATLRGAGVEVQELVTDAWRALPLQELVRAIR
jgi:alpha/beta hydrolase fold